MSKYVVGSLKGKTLRNKICKSRCSALEYLYHISAQARVCSIVAVMVAGKNVILRAGAGIICDLANADDL